MAYVDLNTIHNPATGTIAPASWGDQVRDNLEFLIDPPACSVFHNAAQSLTSGTVTVLNANSENFDNNAMHSTVTNNSRITAQTAGRYLLVSTVVFATNATGLRQVVFRVDGTTTLTANVQIPGVSGGSTAITLVGYAILAASQYVETLARQTSGGALDTTLAEFSATFITR